MAASLPGWPKKRDRLQLPSLHSGTSPPMAHLCLSLGSLVQAARDRAVLFCDDRVTTAAALHDQVALLSRAFSDQLGTSPGDRIVLLGQNTDSFFISLLAVLDAGAVACPLNWRWSPAELAAALALLQPSCLFVDDHCMPLARQACASLAGAPTDSSDHTRPWPIVSMSCSSSSSPAGGQSAQQFTQQASTSSLSLQQLLRLQSATQASATRSPPAAAPGAPVQQSQQLQLQLLHPGGPEQPALVVFTSGTTGASKGVMLSHASLTHQSLAKLAVVGYCAEDTYLHLAPLFHVGGLSSAFAVLMAGGAHVLMPSYTPHRALQLIQQHSVTALIAVPAMMQDLTQAAASAAAAATAAGALGSGAAPPSQQVQQQQQQQLPSLQRVLVGAGGMPPRLQAAVAALFPRASLQTAYGMTEAASSMTFVSLQEQQQLTAAAAAAMAGGAGQQPGAGVCVGKPGPGIAVSINPAAISSSSSSYSSQQLPPQQQQPQHPAPPPALPAAPAAAAAAAGVVGEVVTRGPHVMLGYWRDPQATRSALNPSGWLHTGDLGYLDTAGNLWLVGRLKDTIKSGGENVHAAEVEGVLLRHPAVAAAAVFGLEHERLGEQVAAAVVLQPGWVWEGADNSTLLLGSLSQQQQQQQGQGRVVSAASLQQHCKAASLSGYKLPRVLVCVAQLPLNSSGKVVKAALKQQVQQALLAAGQGGSGGGSTDGSSGGSSSGSGGLRGGGAVGGGGVGSGGQQLRSKL